LSLPFSVFYGIEMISWIASYDLSNSIETSFLLATGISFFVCFFFLSAGSYIAILDHELVHNIMAVLTFNKPMGLFVDRQNQGGFFYQGKGNVFITLGPYFFLTLPLIVFPLYWIIDKNFLDIYFIALGLGAGFQLSTTIKESHPRQSDFREYGLFFSYLIVIFFNIVFYGMLVSFTQSRMTGIKHFIKDGFNETVNFLGSLIHYI